MFISPAVGQQTIDQRKEYNVKAAFIYSFGRYVAWPKESFVATGDRFVIGIVGDSPLTEPLQRIAQRRKIGDRTIEVAKLATPDEYRACQILFVAGPLGEATQHQLASIDLAGVLVIGESNGFAGRGGAINFYLDLDNVRFEINPEAAKNHGLRMDAKLLTLGRPVAAE